METLQDKALWRTARKRAEFKRGLLAYLLVNAFLWAVYLINFRYSRYPWPLWVMLGWGIGLAFAYAEAYHNNKLFSAEKEYEKMKQSGKY
jgi:hypothetical protein